MESDQIHTQSYMCFPLSEIDKNHLESGNKIIMPASALSQDVVYPILFRIEKSNTSLHSHCGVVEFTADEGFVFLPLWMMKNMKIREGELVNITNTSLPKGNYIKVQPHDTKFINTLSDHKLFLTEAFTDFSCLTTGDTIVVNHDDDKYLIDIVETKPSLAISLFKTDYEVEFATPLDYKEEDIMLPRRMRQLVSNKQQTEFKPFTGKVIMNTLFYYVSIKLAYIMI